MPPIDENQDNVVSESQRDETTPTTQQPASPPRRRRHKQLSTDSLNWGIPHNNAATLHVQEEMGVDSWRYQLIKTLYGRRVQIFLASLLLLDVLILFCELALLTLFPSCQLVERDAISCCPVQDDKEQLRWLAGGSDENKYYSCAEGFEPNKDDDDDGYQATCDSHKWHTVHVVEMVLICVTITILLVFFVELTLCMIALKPGIFFRQVFYAVDFCIVTISLGLEVLFVSLGDEVLASLVGLVIVGRLWRFVRIGHGIVELTEELTHEKHELEVIYTRELELLLEQHGIPLPALHSHHGHKTCDLLEQVHSKHINKKLREYHRKSTHGTASS